ncbi:N-6 DNA methylase [Elizabethkingia anophelis]|uniref:site-specific DNA-methyltransferase (adenine-specific) n=1 Tax=Elizabethkingia anophelis NUHP1 TaxID=1338011 RepID=A0A077EMW6_9FLAO|nr:N-6 DNA methylase [Elizabethkingia anophelis]AIL47808.1 Restriction modification enzyme [Elizabethkingia anophelis NUHP1]
MDKELTSIEIDQKAKYFWKYLESISQEEVIKFIEQLSAFSHVFIFSGIIRNFFLDVKENARDIDIVYQGDDNELYAFLENYKYTINSFNGYKVVFGSFTVDLWKLDSTWAIKNSKLEIELFNQYVLPDSTFFNFSSIIYDYFNEKFIYTDKFIEFVNSKTLDLVLEENPLPQLCIINTLYYKEKFGLKISEELKLFCVTNFKKFNKEDYDIIQLKHFNEIKYSYLFIEEHVEIFKNKISSLLYDLDLLDKDELFLLEDLKNEKKVSSLNSRTKEILLNSLRPQAFFCINGEPLILFFDNSNNIIDELEVKIWNFNQSAVIFINNGTQWHIKNGFKILENGSGLESLSGSNLNDFDYFEIISGKSWEKFQKSFRHENRVDYYLLNNISAFRDVLKYKYKLDSKIANSLIGRAIFVRYLIDRGIDLDRYRIKDQKDFNNILYNKSDAYKLFNKILEDFKGNLFPLSYIVKDRIINEEDEVSQEHLNDLIYLLQGAKLTKLGTTQLSLEDLYDFSIIPIEFISNIYERFIGQENQADKGAYYTPLFLVEYIEQETVNSYFKSNPKEENCKILDPACGSGIFLVESFRKIINQYKSLHPDYNQNNENYLIYKAKLVELLKNNIFGVDQDENAINIAIFSLYITLLDNLEPKSIQEFEFPTLLGINFFVSDFFDLKAPFNIELKKHFFQFVLGNPPWKTKHPKDKQLFEKYVEQRKLKENSDLEIENREIAEAFLIRISDFNFYEAGLIIVSKVLYKLSRKSNKGIFRKYFLTNFLLRKVVELSSVRHQIFNQSGDAAIAPASILFYQKIKGSRDIESHITNHISLKPNIFFEVFKIMVIEKYDIKNIFQKHLIEDDWLWKVLVYGNILDYYFIKRFKTTKSIFDYINNQETFVYGKGISVGGGDENNISQHKEIEVSINSKQKGLKSFHLEYSLNLLKDLNYVHRPRNIELFKAPILLVGKGVSSDFKARSAISYRDVIYTDAITGIKPLNDFGEKIIYTLESLFNSRLFSYFLVETNSSIGIEREQTHDKEDKFSIPLIIDESEMLRKKSDEIKRLYQENLTRDFKDYEYKITEKRIKDYENDIDDYLLELYQISPEERELIEYVHDITIPLLKGNPEKKKKLINKIDYKDIYLENYAKVFINHFKERFNSFGVEILWSKHIILMKFIINSTSRTVLWEEIQNKELIRTISKLGFEHLSNNLFLQKDIKGFEEEYFYIAKPNQYKSWHGALAYLDLAEFIEAFFKIEAEYNQ